jgi:phosphodiesterase/alkaline phosphatase D-like protein
VAPDRRSVLAGGVAAAGFAVAARAATVSFTHGVASGDPLHDAVIIWTRAVPQGVQSVAVTWEVAETEDLSAAVRRGEVNTDASRDFIVKVDVTGLEPGRVYFYRFASGSAVSPVGRTRTFPFSGGERLKLAAMCCANIGNGFFNVYRHCADRDDIDVVLHVGDYIYEYATWDYTPEDRARGHRTAEPRTELITLDDYRRRYASYRADPDLQAVHRRHPFIVAWDDHEIANNAFKDGSENHDEGEGTWESRRAAATQAYFEWLPLRPHRTDAAGRIHRSFDVSDLATIVMLDTRLAGRERAPSIDDELTFLPDGAPDYARFAEDVLNAERSILGGAQEAWLTETLRASKARGAPWQIIGQQTIVASLTLVDPTPYLRLGRAVTPSAAGAGRPGQERPFALDTWGGGYRRARQKLMDDLRAHANNTVILSGDLHNAWGFRHLDADGTLRAVEVTTPSVTSPGIESFLGTEPVPFARAMMERNPNLLFAELASRGYAVLTVTRAATTIEWHFVDTVASKSFTANVGKRMTVLARSASAPMRIVGA